MQEKYVTTWQLTQHLNPFWRQQQIKIAFKKELRADKIQRNLQFLHIIISWERIYETIHFPQLNITNILSHKFTNINPLFNKLRTAASNCTVPQIRDSPYYPVTIEGNLVTQKVLVGSPYMEGTTCELPVTRP
jgi:hypothetical protein